MTLRDGHDVRLWPIVLQKSPTSRWHGELGEFVVAGNQLTPGELGIFLVNVRRGVSLFYSAEAFLALQ